MLTTPNEMRSSIDFHALGPIGTGLRGLPPLTSDDLTIDFEFTRNGVGPAFESFMVVGDRMYLICNNTVQTMDAISRDPLWLGAQVPFVELSEKFRSDPLSLAG